MKAHWQYFKYVLRHKIYVYRAGRRLGVGFLQLVLHDWSKFLPSEWIPYRTYFYAASESDKEHPAASELAFNYAWMKHIHRQPHHWQHWCLRFDDGRYEALPMPDKYVREMVGDWEGAKLALGSKSSTQEWYDYGKRNNLRVLHPLTEARVETLLFELLHTKG